MRELESRVSELERALNVSKANEATQKLNIRGLEDTVRRLERELREAEAEAQRQRDLCREKAAEAERLRGEVTAFASRESVTLNLKP